MTYTLAILGCGVMGQAVLSSVYNAPKAAPGEEKFYPTKIIACNYDNAAAQQVYSLLDTLPESPNKILVESTYDQNIRAVKEADVIILGLKPFLAKQVLDDVRPYISNQLLISLAAGWNISELQNYTKAVSRVMTNTPAKYGYGCAVVSHSNEVSPEQKVLVSQLMGHVGKYVELPEKNMNAATALVGSGPAFVLLVLESMMECGLKMGIPLKQSQECAMQVLEGTVKMVEKSGTDPSVLKHQVCTPGGTTIAGLVEMENNGVKSGIIKGIEEAANVAAKLEK